MANDWLQNPAAQWQFPSVSYTSGRYQVRITTRRAKYDLAGLGAGDDETIRLTGQGLIVAISDLDKPKFDSKGQLRAPSIDVTIADRWRYTGVLNGSAYTDYEVESDLSRYGTTLLDHILSDGDGTQYLYVTRKKPDGTTSVVFAGRIDTATVPREHTHVHKAMTTDQVASQTVTLTATALVGELTESTVADLVSHIGTSTTHFAFGSTERPFFNGFTWQAWRDTPIQGLATTNDVILHATDWHGYVCVLAHGRKQYGEGIWNPAWIDTTVAGGAPRGTWCITLKVLLERIASICGFVFDIDNDFSCAIKPTYQTYNDTTDVYEEAEFASDILMATYTGISYNYLFGVSPYDGTEFTSPVSYAWSTPLADVIRDICWQFGCVLDPTYDDTTGETRLRLVSIRREGGAFPSNLTLSSSRVQPRDVKPTHVLIKQKGAEGATKCPKTGRGDALEITVPLRTRPHGETAATISSGITWRSGHLFPPTPKAFERQRSRFFRIGSRYSPDTKDHLEEIGWITGAHLYQVDASSGNTHYPANITLNPVEANRSFGQTTFEGMYGLRSMTEKSGTYDQRTNATYALAQLYAREMVGAKTVVEAIYVGATDDDGDSLLSLTTDMEATWSVNGVDTTMRIERVRIDPKKHVAAVTWVEKPDDYDALADLPTEVVDSSESTGGTSSSSTTTGSSVPPSLLPGKTGYIHVDAATTANITLSSATTSVDGYTYAAGDLILVKNQSTASQNGVYVASTTATWVRWTTTATDMRVVHVMRGSTQAGYLYEMTTDGTIVVGTDSIAFDLVRAYDPTAIHGSGTAHRVAKWATSSTLADSPLVTETGTVGLGAGVTTEPTDCYFYINNGNTVAFNALKLDSLFTSNTEPCLLVRSTSQGAGIAVNQNAATSGTGPLVGLTHTSTSGNCITAAVTAGSSGANGIVLTLDATTTGSGVSVAHSGSGVAGVFTGKGSNVATFGVISGATATTGVQITNSVAGNSGACLVLTQNGTGSTISGTRSNAGASSVAFDFLDSLASTGSVFRLRSASGSATGILAELETATNNTALQITSTDTGSSARGILITTAGTADTFKAIATGDGRGAYIYRNVASAAENLVLIHDDHSTSAAVACRIISDGSKAALLATANGTGSLAIGGHFVGGDGAVAVLAVGTADGGAIRADSSGTAHTIVAVSSGSGWAFRATGGVDSDGFRLRGMSPAVGDIVAADTTDGDFIFEARKGLVDPECLASIHTGSDVGGTVTLAMGATDTKVQVTFQTEIVCNDQIDFDPTDPWQFTPTNTPANETHGVTQITVSIEGDLPTGGGAWATANLSLWVRENNGAVYYRIDRRRYATGETKFFLGGSIDLKFVANDDYRIYISQDHATNTQTISEWDARVSTTYQHTDDCAACIP